jgi:hypothetical protein
MRLQGTAIASGLIDSKKEERANVRRDSRVCEPENAILLLYLYLHTLSLSPNPSLPQYRYRMSGGPLRNPSISIA